MPSTKVEIGTVARVLSPASMPPTMPAVPTMTVWFAPAKAWAIARTNALRRARRSPSATSILVSAIADIRFSKRGFVEKVLLLNGQTGNKPLRSAQIRSATLPDGAP
jgi:hypothetical protein